MAQDVMEFTQRLAAARAGDAVALGDLFAGIRPELVRTAEGRLPELLRSKGSGSDLAQDAILEAQRVLERFTGSTEPDFRAWVVGILLNQVNHFTRSYLGTAKRQARLEVSLDLWPDAQGLPRLAAAEPSPSGQAEQNEEDRQLLAALSQLPEADREIIHWRNFEKLPFALIGQRQGKSEDAARMQWARAIEKLRRALEADRDTPAPSPG